MLQATGKDVYGQNGRSFTSGGNNRLTIGGYGFTNGLSGDYVNSAVDYIVTDLTDSFSHTNDNVALSIREAIDNANTTVGTQEIWLPAWRFTLTRARNFATQLTDTDVSFGDLDIRGSLVLRGVSGPTSVHWKTGVNDAVFELLGDYNGNGTVDAADYTVCAITWGKLLRQGPTVTEPIVGSSNKRTTIFGLPDGQHAVDAWDFVKTLGGLFQGYARAVSWIGYAVPKSSR